LRGCGVERHKRYDNFVKVVVEGAEKLGAKKSEEASLFERADVSSVRHGALPRIPGYLSAKLGHNARASNRPEFFH
jgi:hypothetical protein